ncbi:MAG: hypothetical protein IKN78_00955 [Bacteroidales bacterium]|nr:hypothetical protein [Bacteroidales bacterium]
MNLIDRILQCKTLSITGMAKNTGKTVALNYLLEQLRLRGKCVAVTSIGIDGEKTDQVTQTEKPEIELFEGTVFVTSEYHYRQRQLLSEIMDLSDDSTSLGRLVTARVLHPGKVILSGPATTGGVRRVLQLMGRYGVDLTIVDGALSRKSHAAPTVTDGLILSTGTAIAPDLRTIVQKTSDLHDLMLLPEYEVKNPENLLQMDSGIYALENGEPVSLNIPSSLLSDKYKTELFAHGNRLFVSGILTDMMLNFLKLQPEVKGAAIVVKDFTKIFVSPMTLRLFRSKGGELFVLKRPNLLAVTVNPVAPSGFTLPSQVLVDAMEKVFEVPVYDVVGR